MLPTTETSLVCLSKTAARLSFQLQKRADAATTQPANEEGGGAAVNKDFDYYYNRYKPFFPWLALTTGGVGVLSKLLGGGEKSPSFESYLPWLLLAGLGGYGAYTGWGQNDKETPATSTETNETPPTTTQPASPTTQPASPTSQSASPTTQSASPTSQSASPTTQSASPTTQSASPTSQSAYSMSPFNPAALISAVHQASLHRQREKRELGAGGVSPLRKASSRDELLTAARMALATPTTMIPGAPDSSGIPGTPMTNDTPGVSNAAPVKPIDATPAKPPAAPGGPARGPASTQKNP